MPWKSTNKQEQRFDLVRQMMAPQASVVELCRRFKISRQTAYKWRHRFRRRRLAGLKDRSRCPARVARRTTDLWLGRLRRLRGRRPTWGARKLRQSLDKQFGRDGLPAVARSVAGSSGGVWWPEGGGEGVGRLSFAGRCVRHAIAMTFGRWISSAGLCWAMGSGASPGR